MSFLNKLVLGQTS